MAPAITAQNISPASVTSLLPKLSDADADIRYMSLNDLDKTLRSGAPGFLLGDYHTCAKTLECLMKTLDDSNGEVQNQAIKCLGALTTRGPPELFSPMVEKLSTLETTNSIDSSIPATALRTFITSFQIPILGVPAAKATQDAYSAISKVLIPRLVGHVVNSAGISKAQPSPPPGMLEVRADRNVNSDSIDILIDMIRCFGPMLQDSEKKALQKATLAIFDQSRTSLMIKKKAIGAIALLAVYMSDSQLDTLISHAERTFERTDLSPSQHRLLIAMIGSLARSIPQRLGPFLKTLIPFILNILNEQEFQQALEDISENGAPNPEAEEVREAALVALEGFLSSCSNDMRPFTDDAIEAGLRSVCYDPNVTVDGEDDEMSGTQHEGEDDINEYDNDDEDFEEEGALSDDDDGSWKIRRCGAKILYAIISTRSSGDLLDNGLLYQKIAPILISRFVEREENVRLEVLSTLTSLVRKTSDGVVPLVNSLAETEFEIPTTIEARSRKRRRLGSDATLFDSPGAALSSAGFHSPDASPAPASGPRADLARLSSTIIRGVSKLLKQSPFATKQAAIALLHAMVTVQRGGLSEHFPKIADPLIDATKSSTGGSISQSLGSAASATGSKLRIEALQLVSAICDTHSSGIFVPYITNLIPAVAAAVKDKYFKISSEAILAVESLVKMLTPPRSASAEKASSRSIAHLYEVVLDRALATDADLEVRQRAIHALGVLLARSTGPKVGVLSAAQKNNAARVLLDRIRNETTRHAAVRAVDIFVVSVKDPKELQAEWVQNVALELGTQLRKADRSLRGASLAALRDLVANPVVLNVLDDNAVSSLAGMLLPLVNSDDLNLLGMAVVILAKLVHHSPRKVVDQTLNNAICEIVITSLAGAVLDALMVLIKAIGEHHVGQPLMHGLLQVVGVNGDPAIVGKAIGTLLCSGGSTVGVKIDDFVIELQSATDDKRKCLALSVLGEAGLRLGASSPLDPGLFTKYFNSKSQQLPRAAAVALGRAGAGNISVYLPVILSSSSKSGSTQYLSLHAIKEILQFTGQVRTEMAPYTRKVWDKLLVASQEEDNKAVGAECIGRLAVIEPKTFLPLLSSYLQDSVPTVRSMVIQAIRFTMSDSDDAFDEVLQPLLVPMLASMLNDTHLENRRLALGALNSATNNKSNMVIPQLPELMPSVIKESKIKPELVREVQMGPFKHKVDDGLEVRKSAYETLYSLMESAYTRISSVDLFDRIVAGLGDEHEIKVLCNLMLTKLIVLDPKETSQYLDAIAERYRTTLTIKPKDNAVKQEVEKLNEANKGVLKVSIQLHDAFPAASNSGSGLQGESWKGYWDWVNKDFRGQLASAEQEMKSQVA